MLFVERGVCLWTREFLCSYSDPITKAIKEALSCKGKTSPLMVPFSKSQMTNLINSYHTLLKRYFSTPTSTQELNFLSTCMGSSLLAVDNLEKRLNGVKILQD